MNPRVRSSLGWLLSLVLVVALGGALAAPAVGGPTVLTLSKAKKLFVTKKKANRTFVTKEQAASYLTAATADTRYLTPGSADARYLPRTGETRVPVPPSGWMPADNTLNVQVVHHTVETVLVKNSSPANDVDFFVPVAVPTVIGGVTIQVTGIELCYSFPPALVPPVIDRIAFQRGVRTASVPVPTSLTTLAADETGRVDGACTTVRFAPVALLPTDIVGVGLRIDYPDAPSQVRVGAGSVILLS